MTQAIPKARCMRMAMNGLVALTDMPLNGGFAGLGILLLPHTARGVLLRGFRPCNRVSVGTATVRLRRDLFALEPIGLEPTTFWLQRVPKRTPKNLKTTVSIVFSEGPTLSQALALNPVF